MSWPTEALILHGIIFAVIGIVLLVAGNNHVLAGSARSGIKNIAKLNRWAARRFLILPPLAFTLAWFSRDNLTVGILGFMLLWFAVFGVIIWISVGGKKF